jgi:hypothetical protein
MKRNLAKRIKMNLNKYVLDDYGTVEFSYSSKYYNCSIFSEIFHLSFDGYTEAYLKADFVNTQVTKTQIIN